MTATRRDNGGDSTGHANLDRLAEILAEALAERLAERLEERLAARATDALVDAATVARSLGVSRETVYAHAEELGAVRVGAGTRPRLRFDLERARSAWASSTRAIPPPAGRTARRRGRREAGLLPVRGDPPS